jgi:hypothetical protein
LKRPVRRILVGLALVLLALLAVPAFVVVRGKYFPPTFDVPSIRSTPHYQNAALLERAWALPVARMYRHQFEYQTNGSLCGPSSLANILTSLGQPRTERTILDGTGRCWSGMCFLGLSLDEVAELALTKSGGRVEVIRDLTYAQFQQHLPRFNDSELRYLVNFHRGLLFGKGTGHHSPIGGYLEPENLVFVLDVNGEFEPWLVTPERLFQALDSVDEATGKKRGLVLIDTR